MSNIASLNQLLNSIVNYKVSGYLKVIEGYEPDYSAPDELIYRFKSAVITERKIDGEDPRTFLERLKVLYYQALQSVHKKLDSNKDLIFKNRVFEDALIDIDSVLEILTTRTPYIEIPNQIEIKYIGQTEFKKLERELFKVVTTKIVETILIPLRLSLIKEQNLLPYSKSNVSLPRQNLATANYILWETKIYALHKLMNGVVFEEMSLLAFLTCFDRTNEPSLLPKYIYGYQHIMVYLLSKIDIDYAGQFFKSHFDIKNFRGLKSTVKDRTIVPRNKAALRQSIDSIMSVQ